jgi:hypothetical protein
MKALHVAGAVMFAVVGLNAWGDSIDSRYNGYPYYPPANGYYPSDVPLYPLSFGRPKDQCRQWSYVQMHFPSPLYANSTIFFAGVVAPSTKVNFHIYDSAGNLVKTHQTHFSAKNCVITQENEYDNLGNLAPGTYDVFASYWFVGEYYNYSTGYYVNVGDQLPRGWDNRFIGSITVQ